jgi:alpha-galactosidase
VDFLKYDWCSAADLYKPTEMRAAYKKMGVALKQSGRPILYSLCQYGLEQVWTWGASVGANMWRTTGDLDYNYDRFSLVGFEQNGLERFAGPSHWNDPDMLLVGLGRITDDESRTQVSLWSLLAAPLIASADLTKISPSSLAILSNPEVIAVDQDPAGIQGRRIAEEGPLEIWMKPLADGSKAVGLFNRGEDASSITVYFKDVGVGETAEVRDLWARRDLGTFEDKFTAEVARRGVVMIRMK